jgi:hypothetical protein
MALHTCLPSLLPLRYAIISHVVHLVNRDYQAMCKDYYTLQVGVDKEAQL